MAPISLEIYGAVLFIVLVPFLFSRRAAAKAKEDTTATYDGRKLKLNGKVLRPSDKRRKLVTHILVLPGVTAIHETVNWGVGAFYGCTSLSSITLPEGLTTIGEYAFRDCTSLSSITFPEGLTKIGEFA